MKRKKINLCIRRFFRVSKLDPPCEEMEGGKGFWFTAAEQEIRTFRMAGMACPEPIDSLEARHPRRAQPGLGRWGSGSRGSSSPVDLARTTEDLFAGTSGRCAVFVGR